MIRLFAYLAVLAGLAYTAVLYGSSALLLLAFGGVALLFFAYLYLVIQAAAIKLHITVPIAVVDCKEEADLAVQVRNRFFLPAVRVQMKVMCVNQMTGKKEQIKICGAADARGEMHLYQSVAANHCGTYVFSLKHVKIYDLTGFFCLMFWSREKAELKVMPQIYETTVNVTERSRHFMGEADAFEAQEDMAEALKIRPFQNGDRIQNIHWKMSAKEDELMVREISLPPGCPVVLLLDFTVRGSIGKKCENADALLTFAASISSALIGQNCVHYIAWYSGRERDIVRMRVDSEEMVYLFLLTFYEEYRTDTGNKEMMQKGRKTEEGTADLYHEKYRTEMVVTEICANQNLEITSQGVPYLHLHGRDLKKELEEVEFVV